MASFLRRRGHRVVEVNRPDRRIRHLHGKDDPIDAESAVPSVFSGVPTATPESADGTVEMIRQIKIAKDTAVKSRSQAIITLKTTVIVNAPTERAVYYRGEVSSLDNSTLRLIREQKGRCPHCGEYLLRVDRELASPREWEQWLAATGKAISKLNLIGHRGKGTPDEFGLVHVSRYRRATGTRRNPVLLQT